MKGVLWAALTGLAVYAVLQYASRRKWQRQNASVLYGKYMDLLRVEGVVAYMCCTYKSSNSTRVCVASISRSLEASQAKTAAREILAWIHLLYYTDMDALPELWWREMLQPTGMLLEAAAGFEQTEAGSVSLDMISALREKLSSRGFQNGSVSRL